MARIYKRGQKWTFLVESGKTKDGKRVRTSKGGFKTRKDAQQAAYEYEINMLNKYNDVTITKVTLYDFMYNDWYPYHSKYIKASSGYTLLSHLKRINKYFGPEIKITKITTNDCLNFRSYLQNELKIRRSTSIVTFSYFKRIMNYAANKKNIISIDPAEKIFLEAQTNDERYSLFKLNIHKKFYIEESDLKIVLKKIDSISKNNIRDYEKVMITKIMLNTGLRIGETLSLTWDDIDIENNTISVKKNIVCVKGEYVSQSPKTKSSLRDVSVSSKFMKELNEYRYLLYDFKQTRFTWDNSFNLVFPSLDKIKGGLPMRLNTYRKWLKTLLIDYPKLDYIHPHIFRHTHASLLLQAGANVIDVAKRLGHSTSRITEAIYIHLTRKQDIGLADKIESVLK